MQFAGLKFWSFQSLRFRLFAAFSILTLLISIVFTSLYITKEIDSFRRRTVEKARILATGLSIAIRLPLYAEDSLTLARHASETARMKGVCRVVISNAQGKILVNLAHEDDKETSCEVSQEVEVRADPLDNPALEMFGSPELYGPPLGKVRVEMDQSELSEFINSLLISSALTVAFFWLILSWASVFIIKLLTRNLLSLTEGLGAMREGDYSVRIPPASYDELSGASDAVNSLADELQRRESENISLHKKLVDAMKNEVREERRKMMARLIQTNRMTSLGLLVSSTAHEINTPNGAIRLAGQKIGRIWNDAALILDRIAEEEGDFVLSGVGYPDASEQVLRSVDVISRSSERIDVVVRNLRDYSTGEQSIVHSNVSVNDVVDDSLSIVRAHGRYENVTIEKRLAQDLPLVRASRYQLGQVVTNLLMNAVQAIAAVTIGRVEISTGYDEAVRHVFISVSDNGEGIAGKIRENLFEPFFSTRIEQGGSGLGLYISDYIVKEHSGTLTFESIVDEGSTFTVRIPIAN